VLKYDSDVSEMQRQTEEVRLKMAEEQDKLLELEEYFDKIDTSTKHRNIELEILSAFNKRILMARTVMLKASTNIQTQAKRSE